MSNFSITYKNIEQTKNTVKENIFRAINQDADFIVFPETTFTGLINYGNPENDFKYAMSISDTYFDEILKLCVDNDIYVSLSLLEKDEKQLFDTNIVFDPKRNTKVIYRRISKGWKTANSDPTIYKEGNEPCIFDTKWGNFGVILCGDLFDDDIINMYKSVKYLIHPIICHNKGWFNDGRIVTEKLFQSELEEYGKQVKKIGATSFMVNHFGTDIYGERAFSGAWIFSENGKVIKSDKLYRSSWLTYEIDF